MIKHLKYITHNTAIYSIGQIAPKLVGFILLPFFTNTKYLSGPDYGKLSILEASSLLLITLFGLGLNYALERWYWEESYINKRKSIIFTLLVATIVITGIVWGCLSIFSDSISIFLVGNKDWSVMLNLLFICSALESLILIPTTLLRLQEKPGLFVSANIIRFALYLGFTILFLIYLNRGLEGIFEARLLSLVGISASLVYYVFKNITFKFELPILKEMILFRLPLVLSTISYIIFTITERFSLRILGENSFKDVGVYNIGFTITNSIKLVIISSIWLTVRPMIYKMMNDSNNKRFYSKLMKYMMFIVVFMLLGVTVFGKEVIALLARNEIYQTSYLIIPIISMALIFDTLKEISQSIGLNITKKTGVIGVTIVITTIINIFLNYTLVPRFNIYGAALSTAISQFIFFIIVYLYAQKYYPVPYEIKRIFIMIFTFVVLSIISLIIGDILIFIRIPLKLILLGSFPFILYFFNFYEEIELIRIKQIWVKWKNPSEWLSIITK